MLAKIIGAFIMVAIAVAIFPVINDGIKSAQTNITSTPSEISPQLVTMLDWVPWLFAGAVLFMAILMIANAIRSSGLEDDDYVPMGRNESDDEDEDNTDDEVVEEREQSEKVQKHKTIVTTTKKTGEKKMNIKLSQGYNVDKYELEKPVDTKLTLKEADLNKTKFD